MPRSRAEVRLAHAVLEGKAKDSGMSRKYASEVVSKMHGKHMIDLPDKAGAKPNHCDYDCQTKGESVIDTDRRSVK